jgi:hypothetical protein
LRERKEVRPGVGKLPGDLLGSHIGRCSHDREGLRDGRLRGFRHLCQTEVQHLHAVPRDHHIARLEIAVHDAGTVRFSEGVCDLRSVPQHLFDR